MTQVSINVTCDCGAKMTVTPPSEIQRLPKELRTFELNCCYCQGLIGSFAVAINLPGEE